MTIDKIVYTCIHKLAMERQPVIDREYDIKGYIDYGCYECLGDNNKCPYYTIMEE